MSAEVNLSQKFLLCKNGIIPASKEVEKVKLNDFRPVASNSLRRPWTPCNLHFCHKYDALTLHGIGEHLVRTSGVVRILLFSYHRVLNTNKPHKSQNACWMKWILYVPKPSLLPKGNMTLEQVSLQPRAHPLCCVVNFLFFILYAIVVKRNETFVSFIFRKEIQNLQLSKSWLLTFERDGYGTAGIWS